jgi:23S rRNA (pseudouridine1915-N3)-methyltransferase
LLKIELIAVGTKPPAWVLAGIDHYTSRMKRECAFAITEIKTADRGRSNSVENRGGKNWSTEELAGKLQDWSRETNHFQFLVGGPDGLAPECLGAASDRWSLSKLTFPHFLVRVMLAEQLYRALMVNAGHPYHK